MAAVAREVVQTEPFEVISGDDNKAMITFEWTTRLVFRNPIPTARLITLEDPNDSGECIMVHIHDNVGGALDRVMNNGPLAPEDDDATRKAKLKDLFALSDACIAQGMETWSADRVRTELRTLRGSDL